MLFRSELQQLVANCTTTAPVLGITGTGGAGKSSLIDELLQGSSIAIAADKLGISENTARTQLRSVFGKTNVHRQAELIRLVLTSLAIIA